MKILFVDPVAVHKNRHQPGGPGYFSRHLISYLGRVEHDVALTEYVTPDEVALIDMVIFEWCDGHARQIAEAGTAKKLVIRMRGFDVWGDLEGFPWHNVDGLVFESRFLEELAVSRCPTLPERVKTATIPSGVDLQTIPFKRRERGPHIAMAARAIAEKGFQLAFEWARSRPEYQLHVALAMMDRDVEQDYRFRLYMQYAAPDNVTFYTNVHTPKWLEEIGANFILSASTWETLGYSILEGMAVGLKPLIHDFPGVETNWPPDFVWRGFDDLDRLIAAPYHSDEYRKIVEGAFDAQQQTAEFIARFIGEGASSTGQ